MDVRNRRKQNRVVTMQSRATPHKTLPCYSCNGRGWVYNRVYATCPDCQGRGYQDSQAYDKR